MPRNVEKNIYITLGFARSSPTWQRLQREARDMDISVPHYIKLLLADRVTALEGHGNRLWFPHETHVNQVKAATFPVATTIESAVEDDSSRRATSAAAAANYWED